jgi:hypothetical protein
VQLARSASLYIATKLGDLRDDLVIVGGLVPSLIVPQGQQAADRSLHVGAMDVDLGLPRLLFLQRSRLRKKPWSKSRQASAPRH